MTAKQRAARAKFKAIVKEASKLRKKNPKLTQAQAVKQAWAISYGKAGKKKVGAVPKKKAVKKSATKVKAKKRSTTEQHTDTKSHNVNIRVISGIDKNLLNHLMKDLQHLTNSLSIAQYHLKKSIEQKKSSKDKEAKKYFSRLSNQFRDEVSAIKKQITIQKRLIK